MAEERHIIKKAIVEIHVPSAQSAADLQNKALTFFKEKICPIIERIVAKHSVEGETIRIDKLQLDLKNFKPDNTGEAFLMELEQEIEEKIVRLVSEERKNDFSGEIITDVKRIPKEEADEELFLHLLNAGSLPWWAKTELSVSLEALARKVLDQPRDEFVKAFAKVLLSPAARKRVARRLSPDLIEKIISLVCSRAQEVRRYVAELIEFAAKEMSPAMLTEFKASVYEFVLKYPRQAGADKKLFITALLKDKNELPLAEQLYRISRSVVRDERCITIIQSIAAADEYFAGKVYAIFGEEDRKLFFSPEKRAEESRKAKEERETKEKAKGGIEEKTDEQEKEKEKPQSKKQLRGKKPGLDPGKEEQMDVSADGPEEERFQLEGKKDKLDPFFSTEDETQSYVSDVDETGDHFIKNSGVIILAPYFSALFKELGLYDGKEFVSAEARERAVFLVQYLATGSEEQPEEHEMVLNKILCGLEIGAALTLRFEITDKEKEECLGLLDAVAGNWSALRGTSGEGMRSAFFMRDGILEQQSNGWNLKIERTTIDILLDKLPWGISILQMPWSTEMIFVTW